MATASETHLESTFGDNLARLMGMHRIKVRAAKGVLDVAPPAVSEWTQGKRMPQVGTMMRVAGFFEVPGHSLLADGFGALLEAAAGKPDRYRKVEEKIGSSEPGSFGDNVMRLMGMHRLRVGDADLLGVSTTAVTEWHRNRRRPQVETLMRVAAFFELPSHELVGNDFAHLLEVGAGDAARFEAVEAKIARARRHLKPVDA